MIAIRPVLTASYMLSKVMGWGAVGLGWAGGCVGGRVGGGSGEVHTR